MSALADLIAEQESAVWSAFGGLERTVYDRPIDDKDARREQLEAEVSFRDRLIDYSYAIGVFADTLGLSWTCSELARLMRQIREAKLDELWDYLPEYDTAYSNPWHQLRSLYTDLARVSGVDAAGKKTAALVLLEQLLKGTAAMLHSRGVVPKKEKDVQNELDLVMTSVFADDYCTGFDIAGSPKKFRPDFGIKSLRTAVEVKFADSHRELKTALSGVFEDMKGYEGSADWRRFYSFVYMTAPYTVADTFNRQVMKKGVEWSSIVVTGTGHRTKRTKTPPKTVRRTRRKR
ncbi:MAG TPA: hypothetical protein VNV25_02495 [Gemmatimonadaceae bacterium]|nr:hypothetical protein [Gemmatimonadaceae bacterium]